MKNAGVTFLPLKRISSLKLPNYDQSYLRSAHAWHNLHNAH